LYVAALKATTAKLMQRLRDGWLKATAARTALAADIENWGDQVTPGRPALEADVEEWGAILHKTLQVLAGAVDGAESLLVLLDEDARADVAAADGAGMLGGLHAHSRARTAGTLADAFLAAVLEQKLWSAFVAGAGGGHIEQIEAAAAGGGGGDSDSAAADTAERMQADLRVVWLRMRALAQRAEPEVEVGADTVEPTQHQSWFGWASSKLLRSGSL
jgi:hypothetical protein